MGRQGVRVFSRPLRYRNRVVQLPNGSKHSFLAGEEKGVDVRIALDTIRLARNKEYDAGIGPKPCPGKCEAEKATYPAAPK